MRALIAVLLLCIAVPFSLPLGRASHAPAQSTTGAGTATTAEGFELDPLLEPQVTVVIKPGGERVEEYRVGGKLYMMKVTPPGSNTPFYLIDQRGDGKFARQESHDSGLRPPMWVIHSF
jgi:hypothetical protein